MTQSTDLARILDEGVGGLMFVVEALPLLRAFGGAESVSAKDLEARYQEQRNLNLQVLAEDAVVLARLGRVLTDRLDEQFTRAAQLDAVWQGTAGLDAHSRLRYAIAYGDHVRGVVDVLAATCDAAVTDVVRAVREKSSLARSFEGSTIDGRTSEEIATIVAGTTGGPGGPTPEQGVLWFRAGAAVEADPLDLPAECGRWMRERFAPAIENALDVLLQACDDASRATSDALSSVAGAFDRLDTIGDSTGTDPVRVSPGTPPVAHPSDPSDAVADLIEAGRDLVTAASGLVEATVHLATAGANLATAGANLATAGANLATAGVESATAAVGDALPAAQQATPAPVPEQAAPEQASATATPEAEQIAPTETVPAAEAQGTASSAATGTEGGVVLAEAGPL